MFLPRLMTVASAIGLVALMPYVSRAAEECIDGVCFEVDGGTFSVSAATASGGTVSGSIMIVDGFCSAMANDELIGCPSD